MKTAVVCLFLALAVAPLCASGPADEIRWPEVAERLAQVEYHLSETDEGRLQAPNRAQGLRMFLDGAGMRVEPRTDSAAWNLRLELISFGRGERSWLARTGRLESDGVRADLERPAILEWFVNAAEGIEHGFVLDAPPERLAVTANSPTLEQGGRPDGPELYLELAISGPLSPKIDRGGGAVSFRSPEGRQVLRYSELHVYDAKGAELPSWIESFSRPDARGLRLVIDDSRAVYPLTVDPLLTTAAWTQVSGQASANLGWTTSPAGDLNADGYDDVVIGALFWDGTLVNEGMVQVYYGSPTGLALTPDRQIEGGQTNARLGTSARTAGDVNGDGYSDLLVGAARWDVPPLTDVGKVELYLGSASGIGAVPDWSWAGEQAGEYVGGQVASAGDVNGDGFSDFIAGAQYHDVTVPGSNEGAVYLFYGSPTGPGAAPDWIGTNGVAGGLFGLGLDTAGDFNGDGYSDVVIAEPIWSDGGSLTHAGRIHIYLGSASGLEPTPVQIIEGDQSDAQMGRGVGTAGDVDGDGYADIVVGAHLYDTTETDAGKIWIHYGSATGISTRSWIREATQQGAQLGRCASTAGDVNGDGRADIISGAIAGDDPSNGYIREGLATIWFGDPVEPYSSWSVSGFSDDAFMGYCVGTAGDVNGDGYSDVLVGSIGFDGTEANEGAVYLYFGGSFQFGRQPLNPAPTWGISVLPPTIPDAELMHLAPAGDVNGDGFDDLILGVPEFDAGLGEEGAAFLYLGSAAGLSTDFSWSVEGDQAGLGLGGSVAAGDFNADGYSDLLVGIPKWSNGEFEEGAARLYLGGPGLDDVADWEVESNVAGAHYGGAVASAGDVNGDGRDDAIVGAGDWTDGQVEEGAAFVYHGTAIGLLPNEAWSVQSDQASAWLGRDVDGAGDVNNDGFADVIVGAPGLDETTVGDNEGAALIYHGSANGLPTSPSSVFRGEIGEQLGLAVAGGGDITGDGYSDVLIGSFYATEGRVYLNIGGPLGLETYAFIPGSPNYEIGRAIATAGDYNGDGYADFVVGSYCIDPVPPTSGCPNYAGGPFPVGRFYLGGPDILGFLTYPLESGLWEATAVASAGDVNGDGFAEIALAGRLDAQVIYGGQYPGLTRRVRQLASDGGPSISPGLRTAVPGEFWWSAESSSSVGRVTARAVIETKERGIAFDGVPTARFGWFDSLPSQLRTGQVTGLNPVGHHWRMRFEYDRTTSPYVGASAWFAHPRQGGLENDFNAAGPVPCSGPDQPVTIFGAGSGPGMTFEFDDPNPIGQVSGYNVYSIDDPAPGAWNLIDSNVQDADDGTPGIQWVENPPVTPAPGMVLFYTIHPTNVNCGP